MQQEMKEYMNKTTEEKIQIEQKLQKVKLCLRDSEQNVHKLNIDFEK